MSTWADTSTSTSTNKMQTQGFYTDLLTNVVDKTQSAMNQPFQNFTGEKVAPLTANENQGIANASVNAGKYNPLLTAAGTTAQGQMSQNGPTPSELSGFMNPYTDYVLNNSLARLNEQSQANNVNIGSMAAMQGAFGGTRHGVLEGANMAELLKSSGELSNKTYSDAFDKGMSNWNNSQSIKNQGVNNALNTATSGQTVDANQLNDLMKTGATQRSIPQAQNDFNLAEFLRQQADPMQKAGFGSAAASAFPLAVFPTTGTISNVNTPSTASQIVGGLATAASLYSAIGSGSTADPNGDYGHNAKGGLIKNYAVGGSVEGNSSDRFGNFNVNDYLANIRSRMSPSLYGSRTQVPGPSGSPIDPNGTRAPSPTDTRLGRNRFNPDFMDRLTQLFEGFGKATHGGQDLMDAKHAEQNRTTADNAKILEQDALRQHSIMGSMGKAPFDMAALVRGATTSPDMGNSDPLGRYSNYSAFAGGGKIPLPRRKPTPVEMADPRIGNAHLIDQLATYGPPEDGGRPYGELDNLPYFQGMVNYMGKLDDIKPFNKKEIEYRDWMINMRDTAKEYRRREKLGMPLDDNAYPGNFSPWAQRGFDGVDVEKGRKFGKGGDITYNKNERDALTRLIQKQVFEQHQVPQNDFAQKPALRGSQSSDPTLLDLLRTDPWGKPKFAKGGVVPKYSGKDESLVKKLKEMVFGPEKTYPTAEQEFDASLTSSSGQAGGGEDKTTWNVDDVIDHDRVYGLGVQRHESGSNKYDAPRYDARPIGKDGIPMSSAFGIGQWTHDSWNRMVKANPELKLTPMPDDKITYTGSDGKKHSRYKGFDTDKIPSKEEQDKAWPVWIKQERSEIGPKYARNYPELFNHHQLGQSAWDKLSRAPADRKMEDAVGYEAAHNVGADGLTVGQYRNRNKQVIDDAEAWERKRLADQGGFPGKVVREASNGQDVATSNRSSSPNHFNELTQEELDRQRFGPHISPRMGDVSGDLSTFQAPYTSLSQDPLDRIYSAFTNPDQSPLSELKLPARGNYRETMREMLGVDKPRTQSNWSPTGQNAMQMDTPLPNRDRFFTGQNPRDLKSGQELTTGVPDAFRGVGGNSVAERADILTQMSRPTPLTPVQIDAMSRESNRTPKSGMPLNILPPDEEQPTNFHNRLFAKGGPIQKFANEGAVKGPNMVGKGAKVGKTPKGEDADWNAAWNNWIDFNDKGNRAVDDAFGTDFAPHERVTLQLKPDTYWSDLAGDFDQYSQGARQYSQDVMNAPYIKKSPLGRADEMAMRGAFSTIPMINDAVGQVGRGFSNVMSTLFDDAPDSGPQPPAAPKSKYYSDPLSIHDGDINYDASDPFGLGNVIGAGDRLLDPNASPINTDDLTSNVADDNHQQQQGADLYEQYIRDAKKRMDAADNEKQAPFLGMFGHVNKGLLNFGLTMLSSPGKSFAEDVGLSGKASLDADQADLLMKQNMAAKRFDDAINARYKKALVDSLDPNKQMKIAKFKAEQDRLLEQYKAEITVAANDRKAIQEAHQHYRDELQKLYAAKGADGYPSDAQQKEFTNVGLPELPPTPDMVESTD